MYKSQKPWAKKPPDPTLDPLLDELAIKSLTLSLKFPSAPYNVNNSIQFSDVCSIAASNMLTVKVKHNKVKTLV